MHLCCTQTHDKIKFYNKLKITCKIIDYAIISQLTGEFTALEVFFLQIGGKRKKSMIT